MGSTGTMGVKLEANIKKRLQSLARLKDRSAHWMMRTAILEYLDREEAREREKKEDRARWERYEATGRSIADKDVSAWLDSVGTDRERPCPL